MLNDVFPIQKSSEKYIHFSNKQIDTYIYIFIKEIYHTKKNDLLEYIKGDYNPSFLP
jgi:hypothetical protein